MRRIFRLSAPSVKTGQIDMMARDARRALV
jgi:hypothetical protein